MVQKCGCWAQPGPRPVPPARQLPPGSAHHRTPPAALRSGGPRWKPPLPLQPGWPLTAAARLAPSGTGRPGRPRPCPPCRAPPAAQPGWWRVLRRCHPPPTGCCTGCWPLQQPGRCRQGEGLDICPQQPKRKRALQPLAHPTPPDFHSYLNHPPAALGSPGGGLSGGGPALPAAPAALAHQAPGAAAAAAEGHAPVLLHAGVLLLLMAR